MANTVNVTGKSKGISVDNAIREALKQAAPAGTADSLLTLRITEIRISKGGMAGIEETEVKGEVSRH